ncbi:hypothetical protein ACFFRR_006948 [Megaselia abdita]
MSINITAHQKCVKNVNVNLLKDVDAERRKLLEERKKTRLQQVRERSKELAKRVRKNVNEEYNRQINSRQLLKDRNMGKNLQQRRLTPWKLPRVLPEETEESNDDEDDVTITETNNRSSFKENKGNNFSRSNGFKRDSKTDSTKTETTSSKRDSSSSKRDSSSSKRDTSKSRVSSKKNVTPATDHEECSLSTTSSSTMSCDSDSNSTDQCTICINKTCLTTTKPVVLEITSRPPNIKVFEEKFCSDSEDTDPPNIQIIEKKIDLETKSVEIICSGSKTKPHFKDVTELLKRKHNNALPENPSYEYNIPIPNPSISFPVPSQSSSHPIKPKTGPRSQCPVTVPQPKNDVITFDYNNKFTTSNLKTANTVQRESAKNIPNANFQAQLEIREKFIDDQNRKEINRKIEERGALALQRELITKDFNDLKAKLDIIAKQKSLCDDATVFANIRPKAKQEKREKEMKKFEELLKQPKILTCPEYNDFEKEVKDKKVPTRTEINIADHRKPQPQESSLESNSCCSILLDVVNKTNKKVTEDLNKKQYNEKQCEQLDKLLKKIDEIRKILKHELSKCKPSSEKDMKKAMDSVVSVIKERQNILSDKKTQTKKTIDSDSVESVEVVVIKSPKKKKVSKKEKVESDSTESVEIKKPFKLSLLKEKGNDFSSSTNYLSPPDRVVTRIDKICKKKEEAEEQKTDPELMNYIQRLLGMTRTSINALGLSSSSVTTPNSSTIAIESNVDHEITKREEYISENYAFIERMRNQILTSPQMEGFSNRLTKNWEDSLKNISPPKNENESVKEQDTKSPEANTTVDTAKIDRLSENVEQRINELNEMILKVRKEKQKILQSTIPCAFEEEEKEEIHVVQRKSILKKNVPMTLSRDSGLSSRPTSTQPLETSPDSANPEPEPHHLSHTHKPAFFKLCVSAKANRQNFTIGAVLQNFLFLAQRSLSIKRQICSRLKEEEDSFFDGATYLFVKNRVLQEIYSLQLIFEQETANYFYNYNCSTSGIFLRTIRSFNRK